MKPWTTYRDNLLKHSWRRGVAIEKLASMFDVSEQEIGKRIIELNLSAGRRREHGDAAFVKAMLAARKAGLEKFALGVVTEPGTQHPKLRASRPAFVATASALNDA